MSGWGEYLAAWAVFLLSHMIPARPAIRARIVAVLGRRAYLAAYSLASVVIFLWLLLAAGRAPYVGLWAMPPWGPWAVLATMVLALGFLVFGLGRPNPLSFAGTSAPFDPAGAGILRFVRHPVLASALLWALAHLVVNGDLAHLILFGGFALFAVFGMIALDRRNRRRMGDARWSATLAAIRAAPLRATRGTALRAGILVALVLAVIAVHPWLAGVDIEPLLRF
ncbi:MAG: NnrU family protein [Rubellimicrobium sp.]|nr:NnrU family protein [Rubellimicrobium sp.]